MSGAKVNWYSIGLNQKVEEREPVNLEEAVGIINRYLSYAGQKFKTDKEALAASMFGFSKSKSDFIEICINGSKQFSYKFEFSPSGKPLSRVFQCEEELHLKEDLIKKVTEFFNNSSEELVGQYKAAKKQAKSPLRIPPRASISTRIVTIAFLSIVGLGMLFITLHGIFIGKLETGGRYHPGGYVLLSKNPAGFWILAALYAGIGIWLVRGCVLESKIVQKMLGDRKKQK